MRRVITVNGYRAFHGTMKIYWKNGDQPEEIYGDWLYRPDTNMWYCDDRSFPNAICFIAEVRG